MSNWYYNPNITFHMWTFEHFFTVFLILVLILSLFLFKEKLYKYRRIIRLTVGWGLIVSRISLDYWYVTTGEWTLTSSLPLELCSIASLICGIMLLTKNRLLFEVFYFIAIGGAIQAIITPDLAFGFPQFRYWQFFIDHCLLIIAPLIMIIFYHFRISFKSLLKSFLVLNGIALIVFMINKIISANYMFLIEKPRGGSLLDFLGPYPYYILSLVLVTLIIFFILYLPFMFNQQTEK